MAIPQFTLEAYTLLDEQFMFLFGASVRKATFWMALALALAPG
jgi:hypothetical protein